MDKKSKIIFSVAIGAIAAVIFIIAVTIGADLYLPLKSWLKNIFSHHWIGKSVLAVVVFLLSVVLSWPFSKRADDEKIRKILVLLNWLLIAGFLAIFGFFIYEALIK